MSKNNKNAKRIAAARELSKNRQNGSKGTCKTSKTSKKKNAWWQKFPSYGAFIAGKGKTPRRGRDDPQTVETAVEV
jgi:hypothetical protein